MKNDPAFPSKVIDFYESQFQQRTVYYGEYQGISIRHYFIAKALQGIMANPATLPTNKEHFDNITDDAIRAADTLLAKL